MWHGVSGFEVVLISLLILTPTIFENFHELLVDFLKQKAFRMRKRIVMKNSFKKATPWRGVRHGFRDFWSGRSASREVFVLKRIQIGAKV